MRPDHTREELNALGLEGRKMGGNMVSLHAIGQPGGGFDFSETR